MEEKIARRSKVHTRYYVGGARVPGVTTVLGILNKPYLVPWANSLGLQGISAAEYTRRAARIGTLAHELIQEDLLPGGKPVERESYSPEELDQAENALLKFWEWRRGKEIETLTIEKQLVSPQHGFGGTIDWLGRINGELWLADFKTSSAIHEEHQLQVSAYWALLLEEGIDPHVKVRILRFGREEDEGYEDFVLDTPRLREGFEVFLAALALYRKITEYQKKG